MSRGHVEIEALYREHGRRPIQKLIADTIRLHQDSGHRVGAGHMTCSTCMSAIDYDGDLAHHQAEMVLLALEANR